MSRISPPSTVPTAISAANTIPLSGARRFAFVLLLVGKRWAQQDAASVRGEGPRVPENRNRCGCTRDDMRDSTRRSGHATDCGPVGQSRPVPQCFATAARARSHLPGGTCPATRTRFTLTRPAVARGSYLLDVTATLAAVARTAPAASAPPNAHCAAPFLQGEDRGRNGLRRGRRSCLSRRLDGRRQRQSGSGRRREPSAAPGASRGRSARLRGDPT